MLLTNLHLQKVSLGVVKMFNIQSRILLTITYKVECIQCESCDLNICTYSKNSNRSSKNTQEQVLKANLTVEADVQYWTDCKSPAASSYTSSPCSAATPATKLSYLHYSYCMNIMFDIFIFQDTI